MVSTWRGYNAPAVLLLSMVSAQRERYALAVLICQLLSN